MQQGLPKHNFCVALPIAQAPLPEPLAVAQRRGYTRAAAAAGVSRTLHPAQRRPCKGRAPPALPMCRQPQLRTGLSAPARTASAGLHRGGQGGRSPPDEKGRTQPCSAAREAAGCADQPQGRPAAPGAPSGRPGIPSPTRRAP